MKRCQVMANKIFDRRSCAPHCVQCRSLRQSKARVQRDVWRRGLPGCDEGRWPTRRPHWRPMNMRIEPMARHGSAHVQAAVQRESAPVENPESSDASRRQSSDLLGGAETLHRDRATIFSSTSGGSRGPSRCRMCRVTGFTVTPCCDLLRECHGEAWIPALAVE